MRTFIDGGGGDSTAAVLTYLSTHRELIVTDLYVINTAPNYAGQALGNTFFITDYPSSLIYPPLGLFVPGVISRNEVTSKIGLEADTLQITWAPHDTDILSASPLLTALQGFGHGIFDDGVVQVWRCLMPTVGDAQTFGACNLFSGRIGDIAPDRLSVKLSVINRMETLNEMIPTNLIEPTNILAFYTTGQVLNTGPSMFALVAGSTAQELIADPTDAPGGYGPASGYWNDGYIVMQFPSQAGGSYRAVRSQIYNGTHHIFYLYEPLPFAPTIADVFKAYILVPNDQAAALAQGSEFDAFPYVPSPINSAVFIG